MELTATKREVFGKAVKSLRQKGLVPAELYGRGVENFHLSVSAKDLRKVFKTAGSSAVITVIVDGQSRPVLLHDLQRDPLSDEIIGADFYQVRLDEKIKVKVPIEFIGVAPAVKDKSGIFVKAMQEVEVEALPTNLPQSIKADIGSLIEIGHNLHIKDLTAIANVKVLAAPETVIATVSAPITEEKEAVMEQAVDVGAIKVETEEKKADREADKEKPTEGTKETKTA